MDKNRKKAFTFAELMISLIVISVLSAILYPTIAQFTPNSNKPLFKSAYKTFNEIMMEIINELPDGSLEDSTGTALSQSSLCEKFCEKANVVHRYAPTNNTCAFDCDDSKNNYIVTSNGMRWRFYEYDSGCSSCDNNDKNCTGCTYKNPNPRDGGSYQFGNNPALTQKTFKIIVDVNASNNELSQSGVDADQTFVNDCTNVPKGRCGIFKYEHTTNSQGIYTTIPNYTQTTVGNYTASEKYNQQNLKNQDTFEIYIDKDGKIVSMSPAAWANLEDNSATGN